MSCYKPLVGLFAGPNENGKPSYRITSIGKLYGETDFDPKIGIERLKKKYPDCVLIPCGKCEGCRIDYSREWANRMMLELECNDRKAVFLTLTYNDDCVPFAGYDDEGKAYYTLWKSDIQLFIKKLRRYFDGRDEKHPYRKIRYYFAGEYGPKTKRPHYHAILFGITLFDFKDLKLQGVNKLGQEFFVSPVLDELWFDEQKKETRGFSLISEVSWRTCAYVARYVQKKNFGKNNRYLYDNRIPEFSMMSLKPGIGLGYLDKKPNCLDFNHIHLSGPEGALEMPVPKYLFDKMNWIPLEFDKETNSYVEVPEKNPLLDPVKYANIKEVRKMVAENNMVLKMKNTGLSFIDYMDLMEQNKKDSVKRLYRADI